MNEENEQILISPDKISLGLGDIIQITAPSNSEINEKIFLIDYLDNSVLRLINTDNLNSITLNIDNETGTFTDESIKSISILDKSEEKGYARQNGLLPKVWIDIQFGGDVPAIITGIITDLEEDMIEITTYPEKETIYIDFAYKGMPLDLPIKTINIRSPPQDIQKEEEKKMEEGIEYTDEAKLQSDLIEEKEDDLVEEGDKEDVLEEEIFEVPVETREVREKIKELIEEADDITFGEEEGTITQEVQVTEEKKRYSIEAQANDMLNELLSNVPNTERTRKVMNNIHTIIERFKQLREKVSIKNNEGEIVNIVKKGANYKPLVEKLHKLNQKLYWILPVITNKRKIYNQSIEDENIDDVVYVSLGQEREKENELLEEFTNDTIPEGINKYDYYIQNISKSFMPYELSTNNENYIDEIEVNENIDVIVNNIIKNTQELYASAIDNTKLRSKRFIINRYNLGLKKLEAEEVKEHRMDANITELTKNDKLNINSLLTLPESFVRYSHITLPNTKIYDKTNLHQTPLSYWKLLRKATSITTRVIEEDDNQQNEEDEKYLDSIKHIIFNENYNDNNDTNNQNEDEDENDKYKNFLDLSIPKTRTLFNLIKKYIKENTSYTKIISYLEPFAIYKDDISFKQYQEINKYINENIDTLRMKITENEKYTTVLRELKSNVKFTSSLLLFMLGQFREEIKTMYNIDDNALTGEIISNIMKKDYGKYYYNLISLLDSSLYSDINIKEKLDDILQNLDEDINNNRKKDDTCKNLVLAKHYRNVEDMEYDNTQPEIYYDKKYDSTNYNILYEIMENVDDNIQEEQITDLIKNELIKKHNYNDNDATREAEIIYKGKKPVRNGDYAVLYDEDNDMNRKYLIRKDNQWSYDDSIEVENISDEQQYFCNIQDKCIQVKKEDTCDTLKTSTSKIMKNNVEKLEKTLMSDFDEKTKSIVENINKLKDILKENLQKIKIYQYKVNIKYNKELYELGLDIDTNEIIISPYAKLRDLILAENDLYSKMTYILKFKNNYTRTNKDDESPYWFYCKDTDTKLLPTFYEKLAISLIYEENYLESLEEICKERGEISDDGDKWVDKYSGYTIRTIELTTEEGYDEAGYKIQTNDILEQDLGEAFKLKNTKQEEGDETKPSQDAIIINNVVNALSRYTGMNLGDDKNFVIKNVEDKIYKELPNEETYKRKVKKLVQLGKKVASYEDNKNQLLVYFTAIYFLIAIQTSIPVIKTKKTFEGCIKSFSGFPMENTSDYSGLKYIVCILKKIASSTKPYNTIKRLKVSSIEKNLITIYEKSLSKDIVIQNRYEARQIYLSEHRELEDFPEVHSVSKWKTFLPPLNDITNINEPNNITGEFENELNKNLKNGSFKQQEQLLVIKSKIFYFSLAIQKIIQKYVKKQDLLLQTMNGIPFVENFCCNIDDSNINTFKYFNSKDNNIENYNNIIKSLTKLYYDSLKLSKSGILFSNEDTKLKYPEVRKDFNEETIYRAFIEFCKFNKDVPVNDILKPMCSDNTSQFQLNDTIEEKIRIMKEEGKIYNNNSLLQLLTLVHRENIVHLNLDASIISTKQMIENILKDFEDNDTDLNPILREKLSNVLDTFENVFETQTEEIKDLRNFLVRANDSMKKRIKYFIKTNGKMNKRVEKKVMNFLDTFIEFKEIDKSSILSHNDETSIYTINYMKILISQLTKDFPNIIVNEVNYNEIPIPKHWKLSKTHQQDIVNFVKKTYIELSGHKNDTMVVLLSDLQERVKDILLLVENTPFMSSYELNGKKYISIFNYMVSKELFTFYFLSILESYIQLQSIKLEEQQEESMNIVELNRQTELDAYEMPDGEKREYIDVDDETTANLEQAYALEEGKQFELNRSIANLLISYIKIFISHKEKINYNKEEIYERVLRINEYEKETKRRYLKNLTVEERKADSALRKAKLGQWAVGLEAGVTKYDPEFYDRERKQMETEALIDLRLGEKSDVTNLNRDILAMEMVEEEMRNKEIDDEVYDLSGLPDDDDYGDRDGDEDYYYNN